MIPRQQQQQQLFSLDAHRAAARVKKRPAMMIMRTNEHE